MLTRADVGRLGAALVASSVGLHLLMLHHMTAAPALLTVTLAAVCAPCGFALWRSGPTRAWATTGLMASLMLVVHHAWALQDMPGHGTVLSVLATAVASAEVGLALVAVVVYRTAGVVHDRPADTARGDTREPHSGRSPQTLTALDR